MRKTDRWKIYWQRADLKWHAYGCNGWRLHLRRDGAFFTHYFSDLRYGSSEKSLAAGEKALSEVLAVLDSSRCGANNRITASTIKKARRLLRDEF